MKAYEDVNIIEKGIWEIKCPICFNVFKALPDNFIPSAYKCPQCKIAIDIKLVSFVEREV